MESGRLLLRPCASAPTSVLGVRSGCVQPRAQHICGSRNFCRDQDVVSITGSRASFFGGSLSKISRRVSYRLEARPARRHEKVKCD
jgi:hypothetical protein